MECPPRPFPVQWVLRNIVSLAFPTPSATISPLFVLPPVMFRPIYHPLLHSIMPSLLLLSPSPLSFSTLRTISPARHPSPIMSGSRSGITSFVPTNRCVHEYASEDAGTGYDAHDPRNKRRTCAATCPILAWGKDCRTQRFVGTNLINPVALKWLSMKQMMPRLYPFLDIGKGFFY